MNLPLMSNPYRVSLTSRFGESVQQVADALFTVSHTKKQPKSGRKSSVETPQRGSSKKRPTLTARILRAVKRHEFRTASEIAKSLKANPASVSSTLLRCCNDGFIARTCDHRPSGNLGPWEYFVPTER